MNTEICDCHLRIFASEIALIAQSVIQESHSGSHMTTQISRSVNKIYFKRTSFVFTYDSARSPNKLLQLLARERAARSAPISPSNKRPTAERVSAKRRPGPRPSVWWLLEDDDDDDNTDNDNRLLSLMREQCLEAAQTPIGIGG